MNMRRNQGHFYSFFFHSGWKNNTTGIKLFDHNQFVPHCPIFSLDSTPRALAATH